VSQLSHQGCRMTNAELAEVLGIPEEAVKRLDPAKRLRAESALEGVSHVSHLSHRGYDAELADGAGEARQKPRLPRWSGGAGPIAQNARLPHEMRGRSQILSRQLRTPTKSPGHTEMMSRGNTPQDGELRSPRCCRSSSASRGSRPPDSEFGQRPHFAKFSP
jgi:hypothetical protein